MTIKKLSQRNVRRQLKEYGLYFATMVISISLMYAFNLLLFSDKVELFGSSSDIIFFTVIFVSIIIVIALSFLVSYMTGFILKARSKEFGMYKLMGLTDLKITKMYLDEIKMLILVSFVVAIVLGTLIFQFLMVSIMSLGGYAYSFEVVFSIKAVLLTSLYIFVIYCISIKKTSRRIKKMKIHDLIYFSKVNEKSKLNSKSAIMIFLASIIFLIVGFNIISNQANSNFTFIALSLIVCSIYGVCISSPYAIVFILNRSKSFKLKGSNTFFMRTISGTMQSVGILLGTLTILLTMSIITISMSKSFEFITNTRTDMVGFDIAISDVEENNYITEYENIASDTRKFTDFYGYTLYKNGSNTITSQLEIITEDSVKVSYYTGEHAITEDIFMKISDYNKLRLILGYDTVNLDNSGYIIHCISYAKEILDISPSATQLEVNGETLSLKEFHTEGFLQYEYLGNGNLSLIVVSDKLAGELNFSHNIFMGMLSDNLNKEELLKLQNISSTSHTTLKSDTKSDAATIFVSIVLPLVYLSLILGIISVTILSTHFLMSAQNSRHQYKTLSVLGMNNAKIGALMTKQTFMFFLLPFVFAIVIGWGVFIQLLQGISFDTFLSDNQIVTSILLGSSSFGIIYLIYCVISYQCYKKIVTG